MKKKKFQLFVIIVCVLALLSPMESFAKEKEEKKDKLSIPDHVLSISKENTFPNSAEDQEVVEPSEVTKELLEDTDIPIENPDLIQQLNESSIKPSPIAFGYRGNIFRGRWPLHYKSENTTVNWEYQKVNVNELNNIGGDASQTLKYNQEEEKEVKGALTSKISNPDDVKKMMLLRAKENTDLPLSYETVIGKGTKKKNAYNVPVKKYGYLEGYVPAVNEKGQIIFGEVYLELKGSKKSLVIKNVTKQGIGAWIPVQDHLSLYFKLKD